MAEDNENIEAIESEEAQKEVGENNIDEVDKLIEEATDVKLDVDDEIASEVENDTQDIAEQTEEEETDNSEDAEYRKVEKNYQKYFEDIKADELLPQDGEEEDSLQNKLKNLSFLNNDKTEKAKITPTMIIVIVIIIVGSILMFMNLRDPKPDLKNNFVYELPTMNINVLSEDGMGHNVRVTLGLSIPNEYAVDVNGQEFYNIAYNTVTSMPYEDFDSVDAQYNIKREVEEAFEEQSADSIAVKVYVSGLDVGKASMDGYNPDK